MMNQFNPHPDDDLLALLLADDQEQTQGLRAGATPGSNQGPAAVSFAQQRLWLLQQFNPDSAAYNLPRALSISGELDADLLQQALQQVVERHDILRTFFSEIDGTPRQTVDTDARLLLTRMELGSRDELDACLRAEAARPFDLGVAPLIRATLLRIGAQEHVLLLTMHHIVSDAWSNPILIHDLAQAFARLRAGERTALPRPGMQYSDYARWQREDYVSSSAHERAAVYWKNYLGNELPTLALPTDFAPSAVRHNSLGTLTLDLPERLTLPLKALCQRLNVTPFMALLGAWQLLLARYSGQQDFTVGVPNASRNQSATQELVGFFVSSQIYRTRLKVEQSVEQFLQALRQASLAALEHGDYPIELLLEQMNLQRSTQANPLFQTLFNWRVADAAPAALQLGDLQIQSLPTTVPEARFDLSIDVEYSPKTIRAQLEYRCELFLPQTIARLSEHWQQLLQAMLDNPAQAIGDLPMLSGQERQQLHDWNATQTDYPLQQPIHRLIEQQVARTPEAIALLFAGQHLSYAQLNQRANQLAHHLIALGVGPEVVVGIALERSVEMVIGLLAILKAGGAYLPLDPDYPAERLAYMIEDSGIALLLTHSDTQQHLPFNPLVSQLHLDTLDLAASATHNPAVPISAENLAYVIYTSGSTGRPKGAGNRHGALTNRLCWMQQAYALDLGDTVLQKTPFSFDVSVWEFFWPLLIGARLAVALPGDHRDPARLIELIQRLQITTLHFVPSMLQAFLQHDQVTQCAGLKRIICSGEALPLAAQQQVFAKLPDAALYNLYGPTEAAIDVTHWTCRDEGGDSVPIGQPIANLGTWILDAQLQPVPVGVAGELYLGGVGLARGYHRRPALTAERFVTSPFGKGERLYRTGDLARYRADGVIQYLGRIDHQVKIRGLRIELGEIEACLLALPEVSEAAVIAHQQQLIGYVVPARALDPAAQDALQAAISTSLGEKLPDYMVPTRWVCLAHMPLSANGKLDRKALPLPDTAQHADAWVAAQSPLQQRLISLWQDVLKRERLGIRDNYFDLGGDSIISIQLVSRARQAGIHFTPKQLFEQQTIERLAQVASVSIETCAVTHPAGRGDAILLPIQQAFFERDFSQRQHWNQSVVLRPLNNLDADTLEQALRALLAHHDGLRLTFAQAPQGWTASYQASSQSPFSLWQSTLADISELQQLGDEAQRSLDLQQGPLIRAVLVSLADGSQRLLLVIHHLVVDGVSWRILFDDLQCTYRQLQAGQAIQLPARTSSLQAWSERLQAYARSPQMLGELSFWQTQLRDIPATLPDARADASLSSSLARSAQTRLDQDLTRRLLQDAPGAYRTQINDLLLSALSRVISRWTGQPRVAIQLEGHGREALFDNIDLSRSVGWFTSLYPVSLTSDADMAQTIKTVKEQLRALPGKGIGFGALRYLGDDASREALRQLPMPRITFNYLGQFDSSFADKNPTAPGALFSPCADNAGAEQSLDAPLGNWLTLNGRVYGGELSIGWTYSHEMFDDALMQKLADEYASELRLLVEHCARHQGVTPADFPLANIDQQRLDALPLEPRLIQDLYPLAPMQQGMLFHTLHERAAGNYLNQMRLDVSGLDPERFRKAWQAVLDHHDILRSSFHWQGDLEQPLQMVQAQVQMPFTLVDGQGDSQQNLDALATSQREQGFDLSRAPLLNLIAVQTGAARHHLILTHHHILMDGWSLSQLLGEVLQRYRGQPVEPAQTRYRDYIQWLQQQDQGASEAFWREQFQAFDTPTLLARSLSSGSASAGGNDDYSVALTAQQSEALNAFAREQKVTLNTLLQAAWALLLQRYTGQQRVCFGATVAGRPAPIRGIEQQIGLFINTLPVVSTILPEVTVSQWLQALQTQNLSLREHEHSALADVQRWAGHGGEALFDTLLVFENYPIADALQQGAPEGLHFSNIRSHEQTNYPLTLIVNAGTELSLRLNHDCGLFNPITIANIARQLLQLLTALPAYAQRALGELPVADQADALLQWNPARRTFPSAGTLTQRIETQAARAPGAVALSVDGEQLTYGDLNQRANRLAHLLIERGVGPDRRVGLAAERSVEMIIGLLAILKAGGAYVPLDPAYPQERLRFMIDDSGIDLLLAQASVLDQLPLTQRVDVLLLDHDTAAFSDSNPQVSIDSANLAYVIYTSGSTGQPKGALLSHDNVVRLFAASAEHFQFGVDDVWTLFHSYAFDFSVWEIFGALLHGGRLVIVPHAVSRSPEDFHALLVEQGVTVLNQTPSAFKPLMAVACASAQELALRYVIFGGEALDVASLKPWFQRFDDERFDGQKPQLINMYGITETTVHVTYRPICRADLNNPHSSPIGAPLADLSWYLLDSALNPVPKGCIGELYIGGAGLARGYLNRQDLTATRFIPNLFAEDGSRLYRTGDLARYGEDGSIDYLGRSDQQVKIRGFRIELGEIEAQLLAQPQVRQAVVLARETGSGQQLVAYLVADDSADIEQIRNALKQNLPDYMVPTHLIVIDQLPLTGNGKLDRKALPEPDASLLQGTYLAPQSQLEQQIANIWQDVLKLERVGLGDNFFELGGHSLLVIKVVSRLQLELGLQLTPQQLFQAPTLGAFAASLATSDAPFDSAKLSRLDALLDDMEDI